MITEHEQTYFNLSIDDRKKIEALSIKYGKMINELMFTLAEIVGIKGGTFRWSSTVGYADFFIEGME